MKCALIVLLCVATVKASSSSGSGSGSAYASSYSPVASASLSAPASSVSVSFSSSSPSYSSVSASASSPSYSSVSFSASSPSYVSVSFSASSPSYSVSSPSFYTSASPYAFHIMSAYYSPSISYVASSSPVLYVRSPSYLPSSASVFAFATYFYSPVTNSVPASLAAPTVSSTLEATISHDLAMVAATIPSIETYLSYVELLLDEYPAAECAESTLEQDQRSHSYTVSIIEDALSSPSLVSKPSYVEDLENRYPSVVSAYEVVLDLETSHPQFAYAQTDLDSIEVTHPTILTDISLEIDASSPSLAGNENVVYTALEKSPSVQEDLSVLVGLEQVYTSLETDENIVAYYEKYSPSIVASVSEAVFSPASAHSPLPALYPTLASADIDVISYEKIVPSTVVDLVSLEIESPQSVPVREVSYADELVARYTGLADDCRVIESYKSVSPTIVQQVFTIEESPAVLHEPAVVSHPHLGYAEEQAHSEEKTMTATEIRSIQEFECEPSVLKGKARSQAEHECQEFSSFASAEKVIGSYQKVNAAVVHKCSSELSSSRVVKVQNVQKQHASLYQALKQINMIAKSYKQLIKAQASVDCAESAHGEAYLVSAYKKCASARMSAKASFHHSAVVQKNSVKVHRG